LPKHFRHVGIVVSNLEAAVEAFQLFGFRETKRFEKVDTEQVRKIVGIPDAKLRISILRDSENMAIELLEYVSPSTKRLRPKVNRAGVSHLALRVHDIASIYASRKSYGLSFFSAPVVNSNETAITAYVLVVDEILLELVQVLSPAADYS
jgi:catechol 2,3-dioxygenase-like lactoylglutathione lyase family enzyme